MLTLERPRVETAARPVEEHTFRTHDGIDLFYRHWPAVAARARGAIVMFHRGHEHSGRMAHLVDELALPDFAFFAWDARGHGRSPGERGDSPSFAASVRDLQCFIDHMGEEHGHQRERQAEWETVWFTCPPDLTKQMIRKGAIAIDGVSLTLVDVENGRFSVALIPHTLAITTFGFKQPGDSVNLEIDLFAKYVFKYLAQAALP